MNVQAHPLLDQLLGTLTHADVTDLALPWVLAYSGGVDSTVLLHAAHSLAWPIHALHVNHQLQEKSATWAQHCEQVATKLGVPFTCLSVHVEAVGNGIEEAARVARYQAMLAWMNQQGCTRLITAHHADDQLETVLIQLFRGSGLRGVVGMQRLGPVGVDRHIHPNVQVFRPLLEVTKAVIVSYAEQHQLHFVEDPSNTSIQHKRNWVRHHLLPDLLTHFPQALSGISKLSAHFKNYFECVDGAVLDVLPHALVKGQLHLKVLYEQKKALQLEIIKYWLQAQGVRCGRDKLLELHRQLVLPKGGKRQVAKGWFVQVSQHVASLVFEGK